MPQQLIRLISTQKVPAVGRIGGRFSSLYYELKHSQHLSQPSGKKKKKNSKNHIWEHGVINC